MTKLVIEPILLRDAERIARLTMVLILITAGTSKFFSDGGFSGYYSGAFQSDSLRIVLPAALVNSYLALIPFIEIALGLSLLLRTLKPFNVYGWCLFMASLTVGHYILQEWSEVNQMLDYFFLGLLCLILPAHDHWWKRTTD